MNALEDVKVLGIGSELFAEIEDDAVEGDDFGGDVDEDDEDGEDDVADEGAGDM